MTRGSAHGLTTEPAPSWLKNAACRAEDPELFFPKGHDGPWQFAIKEAKAICYRCPALELCHQWALDNREPHGVWGGLDEWERALLLRRRGKGTRGPRKKAAA